MEDNFQEKQNATYKESKPMEKNTTYMRLIYLFYTTVHEDDRGGWGKPKTYCLFRDEKGNVLRTNRTQTLSYYESPDNLFIGANNGKKHMVGGQFYHIKIGEDGSAIQVVGNGLSVTKNGSKIVAVKA
jgi:hypothetical protein